MRNLIEYPVTTEEKLNLLAELRHDIMAECRIGDMRPLLLRLIAEDVECAALSKAEGRS